MQGEVVARKSPDVDHIAVIETAVGALRRAQKRRALARLSRRKRSRVGPHTTLPDAVFELLDILASAAQPLTVSEAAIHLDVDQPRASKLASMALEAGLLRREADQRDGRRSLLVVTGAGEAVLGQIRDFRIAVIADATSEWSATDRATFARLLTRFVNDFGALTEP
jgi:DNA-binding MarR family transcriptional regulator